MFLILLLALPVFAQESGLYTGFAGGTDISVVKQNARHNLIEGIILQIHGSMKIHNTSKRVNGKEIINTTYEEIKKSVSDITLVGMETKVSYNRDSVFVEAIVYKDVLAEFYASKIHNAENWLATAESKTKYGRIKSALSELKTAKDSLNYYKNILMAVAPRHVALQNAGELLENINNLKLRLENGVQIYIAGEQNIGPQIAAMLGKNNCKITDSLEAAHFILTINFIEAKCYNNGFGKEVCYVTPAFSLYNQHAKEFSVSYQNLNQVKFEYRQISEQITEKIISALEEE